MAGFALFIIVFGTIGYTIEGQVEEIPTPSVEGFVFFSDEALPSNPVGLFVSADTSITWDRDDIFLVIADQAKKDQCDGIRANGGAYPPDSTIRQPSLPIRRYRIRNAHPQ